MIANRGEIAVRIARACRDHGVRSVAVYSDQDRQAPHVRAADEAFALPGSTPAATYLNIEALLQAAARAGATAVHPGYGFLAENIDFAEAVLAAGLTWIGPPPAAMAALSDKVSARAVAVRVGAPLAPGTPNPVAGASEIIAFAAEHGLPLAIKAAYGGGGRGMRVVNDLAEIPEAFAAAEREAVAAFGRGECFVERYLVRPRHVETQCLADARGRVVVVSTRDCSVQRRHQKLVEEAPAPFLSATQLATLSEASKAILSDVGYVGAGTCEFLVSRDGLVSFLEVNTRLQVEHPVSEEVTGIDLVREQLRIAAGGTLDYDDPAPNGHSIEFRINGEDPARGFLPTPGRISQWRPASGPGVRVDAGFEAGDEISGTFDSLIAKLIVTGANRTQALARARRALAEFEVGGLPTVLPFHRALVVDPAFAPVDPSTPFTVHTRWVETEFRAPLPPFREEPTGEDGRPAEPRHVITVEVDGRRMEVALPTRLLPGTSPTRAPRRARRGQAGPDGDAVTAPMQGTVVTVAVTEGAQVAAGDLVVVLEAMKMEQPLTAHRAGVVRSLAAEVGATVTQGTVLLEIRDS
ncbi:MAG: ATP-grasp domain-containing protein [Actinomycetales bacterium]|nr:ATP-grasp domain-containing protein [Actinomycetales bacterium]